ncbi:Glycosyl transferases group 1 [Lachnospiraceae bacterium XBB2008]|nr:Glycosyl transferases group 1 [Lachnospiraceae bacterium XBB2008]
MADGTKKLLIINSVCGTGSTGRICADIARSYESDGYDVKIAYGRSANVPDDCRRYAVRIGTTAEVYLHILYTRLTDRHGLASRRATHAFLKWAEEYDPDILWLHNVHGYYINYELLFNWIKKRPQMQVRWTLHDCWTFTGHCAHYMYAKCDRWQASSDEGSYAGGHANCGNCPQLRQYPASWFTDNSVRNYIRKKNSFTGVNNMTLITPSEWLAGELKKSFLSCYPVEVVRNTIDTAIFRPTPSDIRGKYGISDDEKMILAVAGVWTERKGLGDILKLSGELNKMADNDPERNGKQPEYTYRIVIVGLTAKQAAGIRGDHPDIICIEHTESTTELAQLYTAADVFINPTYEDNYPTVNLEAEACGTPVISYDTGGCRETLHRPDSCVIPQDISLVSGIITKLLQP